MKISAEMKEAILEKLEELEMETCFDVYGIRVQDVPFALGKIDHVSRVWVDGFETDDELPGLCITKASRMRANEYAGDHIAIIAGDLVEYGEDDGELIVRNAEVLAVIA